MMGKLLGGLLGTGGEQDGRLGGGGHGGFAGRAGVAVAVEHVRGTEQPLKYAASRARDEWMTKHQSWYGGSLSCRAPRGGELRTDRRSARCAARVVRCEQRAGTWHGETSRHFGARGGLGKARPWTPCGLRRRGGAYTEVGAAGARVSWCGARHRGVERALARRCFNLGDFKHDFISNFELKCTRW
jgi:hypothetical protein